MFKDLKQKVYEANIKLQELGLVILTWGNVSQRSEDGKFIAIKPSGIEYQNMKTDDIVVLDLQGNIVEGNLKPSSDTPTHLEIYKAFPEINGICHTHSTFATAFAQAGKSIDCQGTTHADYFYGTVPVTRELTADEIKNDYEINTGKVIVETFQELSQIDIQAVLVKSHGVFSWGKNAMASVENAYVLEQIAQMNYYTLSLNNETRSVPDFLLNKHYCRKHGENKYYGQV